MAGALGVTAPSLFLSPKPPSPPQVATGVQIPTLVSGWAGGVSSAVPTPVCPPSEQMGQCLATPYGTVLTSVSPRTPVSSLVASIWIRPLRPNQWESTAAAVHLASLGTPLDPTPRVSLVGATGSWVVVNAFGTNKTVAVDAVNLSGGEVVPLTSLPAVVLGTEVVGSGMALVDNGSYLEVFRLPATAAGAPTLGFL
ncbi:MAG: hypothetical protein ACP5QO_03140, partial [Clostridia bacterium]